VLTTREQDYLYQIIAAAIGDDITIKRAKVYFNEESVIIAEQMIESNKQCNVAIKELFKGLLGGGAALSRGWLRKVLKRSKKIISRSNIKGYACMATSKSKWKSAILLTTI